MERCGRKLKLLMFVVVPRYICNLESPVWDWNWLNIARSKISSPNFPSAVGSSCVFIFLPNLNLTIPFQSWIPAIPSIQEWSLYLFDFWGGGLWSAIVWSTPGIDRTGERNRASAYRFWGARTGYHRAGTIVKWRGQETQLAWTHYFDPIGR